MKKVAFVISVYKNHKALAIGLTSLKTQTYSDFDIFIAEDGKDAVMASVVSRYRKELTQKIFHFTQEDQGVRKAKICNRVFRALSGYETTICVDGDCFFHPRFVEDHMSFHQKKRTLFMGRRVDLGQTFSKKIHEGNVFYYQRGLTLPLLWAGIRGEVFPVLRAMRVKNQFLRKWLKKDHVFDLLGSNFSVDTSLLWEVNGYNESSQFLNYWGEDGFLFIRLRNVGARVVGCRSLAIEFHLWHPRNIIPNSEKIKLYHQKLLDRKEKKCSKGIFYQRPFD